MLGRVPWLKSSDGGGTWWNCFKKKWYLGEVVLVDWKTKNIDQLSRTTRRKKQHTVPRIEQSLLDCWSVAILLFLSGSGLESVVMDTWYMYRRKEMRVRVEPVIDKKIISTGSRIVSIITAASFAEASIETPRIASAKVVTRLGLDGGEA